MAEEKTLKQANLNYLRGFIVLNIIGFLFVAKIDISGMIDFLNLEINSSKILNKLAEDAIGLSFVSVSLYILTTLLAGLIDSDTKVKLIYLKRKDMLPGCRAFSDYMYKDPRVEPEIIEINHGTLPTEPNKQNSLWYRIYKKYQNEQPVLDAHRNFLLMRELFGIHLICFFGLGVAGYFTIDNRSHYGIYLLVLAATLILLALAARNYGVRLVTNVLALETCSKQENIANTPSST
jgi:hypothetical protein